MGWLRDLMRQGPNPPRSLGVVARAALAHSGWPPGRRPQERSFAALLSKLDRGVELEWLADRPAVQEVLADVMGAPRARIAEAVGTAAALATERSHRLRLHDLPYASPLDLRDERLPPGIPEPVLRPAEWSRTWWHAPSGSGRSLAGAWLQARGLASFVSARDWEDALRQLPAEGPVFVELTSPGPAAPEPPRSAICLAAPRVPGQDSTWRVVESPAPTAWLGSLVEWLAVRLPRDGHFQAKQALEVLRHADARGLVDGLGTAIGLGGLVDLYGAGDVERDGISAISARFVRDRLTTTANEDGPSSTWVGTNGPELLSGLARRLLTDSDDPWDAPRTFEEWVRLVPAEYQDGVDADWVRLSLTRTTTSVTAKEIERALRDLPPGAFRAVRMLERAGLLRPSGEGSSLCLAPRWLAGVTLAAARDALASAPPEEWGEALLRPLAAPGIAAALLRRLMRGDTSLLDDVIDLESEQEATTVAAVETAFRIAGIACLRGVDLADDVITSLWDRQMALIVERDDGPYPTIDHPAEVQSAEPLLSLGAFQLAALALAEALPARRGRPHPRLRFGGESRGRGQVAPILDAIWRLVTSADLEAAPWAVEAFAVVERLGLDPAPAHPGAGGSPEDAPIHPLSWPSTVLDAIERGTLDWAAFRDGMSPVALQALLALSARRGLTTDGVLQALWHAWAEATDPLDAEWAQPGAAGLHWETLWKAMPVDVLSLAARNGRLDARSTPYRLLDASQWRALVGAAPASLRGVGEAWDCIPAEVVTDAVDGAALTPADAEVLWRRFPVTMLDWLDRALGRPDARALAVLAAAPPSVTRDVARRVAVALGDRGLTGDARVALRAWLHDRIRARAPGWRSAFEALAPGAHAHQNLGVR